MGLEEVWVFVLPVVIQQISKYFLKNYILCYLYNLNGAISGPECSFKNVLVGSKNN